MNRSFLALIPAFRRPGRLVQGLAVLLLGVVATFTFAPSSVSAAAAPAPDPAPAANGNATRNPFEASVVTLEVTAKDYDYLQPWNKPTRSVRKHGLVLGERELVTTAQSLADRTLVRAQKGGRGRWFSAQVKWIDYHANLAVVTVEDAAFWNGLTPATLAPTVAKKANYDIVRWRDGNLETRRADFSKFTVGEGSLSFAPRLILELNTEIGGLGWAEPVLLDGQVVGLCISKGGNVCTVMPVTFLQRMLQARKSGQAPMLGYFDFVWQQAENPATLDFLKLDGDPRGAVIIEVPKNPPAGYALQRLDILLEVDGFAVDMEGDYEDPEFGHLVIEGLATRRHFAGEKIPMKVFRAGKVVPIEYTLPRAKYSVDLLPQNVFDREPEYLVAGGLVFQPMNQPYLRSWGDDWRRRAPFRLSYFANQPSTPERPTLVALTQVLPDAYNVGYQEYRSLVLDRVNGKRVSNLAELRAALKEPKDGFHRIEFFKGDSLQRILLDADTLESATQRVLKRYEIPAAEVIHATPAED